MAEEADDYDEDEDEEDGGPAPPTIVWPSELKFTRKSAIAAAKAIAAAIRDYALLTENYATAIRNAGDIKGCVLLDKDVGVMRSQASDMDDVVECLLNEDWDEESVDEDDKKFRDGIINALDGAFEALQELEDELTGYCRSDSE